MSRNARKLLVIDDDTSVRQSITAYLEDSGFDVVSHRCGAEALQWFSGNQPDAVLTDLRMPDIDGLQILQRIREISPQTPVIVISGIGEVNDVAEALRLGAADYLVKPVVDMEVLVHSVRRATEHAKLIAENESYRIELERANRDLKEYVRVLERDQKAGRHVQGKLLPEVPARFNNLEIDFKLIPSLYLSGDFIDFGSVSDRYLGFYLTDVSGHGAASAFVTVWLKQLVRRYFSEGKLLTNDNSFEEDVKTMLGLINKEVIQSGFGCHMTCFVGFIDLVSLQMHYVYGGHLPFPILITEESCEYLSGKGKPVGIFPDADWDVYHCQLPQKFKLIAFSDGILEVLDEKELIDKEQKLIEIVRANAHSIDAIVESIGIKQMDTVPDDIAILKVESKTRV